ncbi:MAG: hypothetical protein ACTHNR_15055 [Trinickia sp.]
MSNVFSDCGRFMLTEAEAHKQIREMMPVLEKWQMHFADAGVRGDDIEARARYVRVGEMAREFQKLSEKPARVSRKPTAPASGV